MKPEIFGLFILLAGLFQPVAVAAEINEVSNPGLELGDFDPEGWALPNKGKYTYDYDWTDSGAHGGEKCLKIGRFFDTNSWEYLEWGPAQRFAVNPAKTYYFSFWTKAEQGIYPYSMQIRFKAYKGEWGYQGNQYSWVDIRPQWTQTQVLVQDLKCMEQTENVMVRFFLERCPGWVWVDDVVWREATPEDINRVKESRDELDIPKIVQKKPGEVMPRGKATGKWHTSKIDGAWWLIKPDGQAFWGLGIVSLGHTGPVTNPLAAKWIVRHYSANKDLHNVDFTQLETNSWDSIRKLTGKAYPDFRRSFMEYDKYCMRRAIGWGFNSMCSAYHNRRAFWEMQQAGEQILPTVLGTGGSGWQRALDKNGKPYEFSLENNKEQFFMKDPNADLSQYQYLARTADPFNKSWVYLTDQTFNIRYHYDDYYDDETRMKDPYGGNTSHDKIPVMGYFQDSEPGYFNAWNYIWSKASAGEFISMLKVKYENIKALNRAWSSRYKKYRFKTFEQIAQKPPRPKWFDDPMLPDFLAMERAVYARQNQVNIGQMRKYNPKAMALSPRFESRGMSELMRFMDTFSQCDALCMDLYPSFLVHGLTLAERDVLKIMHELSGRPVWLTEWSVNGRDTMKDGLTTYQRGWVDTQADRGKVYANVIAQLINAPYMLGAKFFTWHNMKAISSGAHEGLNAARAGYAKKNYGLVDENDRPYWPLVRMIQKTNGLAANCTRRNLVDPDPKWKDRVTAGSHRIGIDWLYRKKMKRINR